MPSPSNNEHAIDLNDAHTPPGTLAKRKTCTNTNQQQLLKPPVDRGMHNTTLSTQEWLESCPPPQFGWILLLQMPMQSMNDCPMEASFTVCSRLRRMRCLCFFGSSSNSPRTKSARASLSKVCLTNTCCYCGSRPAQL